MPKKIGRAEQTLRNWDKSDKFKPYHVSVGGTRYYSQSQPNNFLGIKDEEELDKICIGYCRVNSCKQKDDLENQIKNVKQYMIEKGYDFEIITDVGSNMNYDNEGSNNLLDKITSYEVESKFKQLQHSVVN